MVSQRSALHLSSDPAGGAYGASSDPLAHSLRCLEHNAYFVALD